MLPLLPETAAPAAAPTIAPSAATSAALATGGVAADFAGMVEAALLPAAQEPALAMPAAAVPAAAAAPVAAPQPPPPAALALPVGTILPEAGGQLPGLAVAAPPAANPQPDPAAPLAPPPAAAVVTLPRAASPRLSTGERAAAIDAADLAPGAPEAEAIAPDAEPAVRPDPGDEGASAGGGGATTGAQRPPPPPPAPAPAVPEPAEGAQAVLAALLPAGASAPALSGPRAGAAADTPPARRAAPPIARAQVAPLPPGSAAPAGTAAGGDGSPVLLPTAPAPTASAPAAPAPSGTPAMPAPAENMAEIMAEIIAGNAPASPATSASPASPATPALTPALASATMTPPPERAEPRPAPQIETAIAQVGDLREALRAGRPDLTMRHAEFGLVSLRLEAGGAMPDTWRAVLASRDPGFVPAIQAALAERAVAAAAAAADGGATGFAAGQNGTGEHRYGSSPSGGQGGSQPYLGQSGARDGEAAPDHRRPSTAAALAARAEEEAPGSPASGQSGLFA